VIYLDSSALLKLIFEEPESSDLAHWLTDQQKSRLVSWSWEPVLVPKI
jgi:predicted nucleic acid-binding protein